MDATRYINETSLLIINPEGKLKRLYCPFLVTYRTGVLSSKRKTEFIVSKIIEGKKCRLFYLIGTNYHSYENYSIIVTRQPL